MWASNSLAFALRVLGLKVSATISGFNCFWNSFIMERFETPSLECHWRISFAFIEFLHRPFLLWFAFFVFVLLLLLGFCFILSLVTFGRFKLHLGLTLPKKQISDQDLWRASFQERHFTLAPSRVWLLLLRADVPSREYFLYAVPTLWHTQKS